MWQNCSWTWSGVVHHGFGGVGACATPKNYFCTPQTSRGRYIFYLFFTTSNALISQWFKYYNIWVDWFLILILNNTFLFYRTSGSIVKLLDVVCPPERRRVIKVGLNFEWPNRENKILFVWTPALWFLFLFTNYPLLMQLIWFVVSCILVYRYLNKHLIWFLFFNRNNQMVMP